MRRIEHVAGAAGSRLSKRTPWPTGASSARYKTMTLATDEFIRRFLIHVLPKGFHRIRYYGFLTSQRRAKNIAHIRELLAAPLIPIDDIKALNAKPEEPKAPEQPCPCCGGHMRIIETFARGCEPKHRPTPPCGGNQDRHLMMPPLPIADHYKPRDSH